MSRDPRRGSFCHRKPFADGSSRRRLPSIRWRMLMRRSAERDGVEGIRPTRSIKHMPYYSRLSSKDSVGTFIRKAPSISYMSSSRRPLRPIVRAEFTRERKLDRGNANPGNLGEDFGRLGIEFWDEVKKLSPRNSARNRSLEMLNLWRNAIAHQHFDPGKLGSTNLGLAQVRNWRIACDRLAARRSKQGDARTRPVPWTGKTPWK